MSQSFAPKSTHNDMSGADNNVALITENESVMVHGIEITSTGTSIALVQIKDPDGTFRTIIMHASLAGNSTTVFKTPFLVQSGLRMNFVANTGTTSATVFHSQAGA